MICLKEGSSGETNRRGTKRALETTVKGLKKVRSAYSERRPGKGSERTIKKILTYRKIECYNV